MMDLYCKSFVFKVTRYEEWNDRKCVSNGNTNLKVIAIPINGYMVFRILGKLELDIEYGFELNMNPIRQMSDYIQYGALPENMSTRQSKVPRVCKLCNNQTYISFDLLSPLRNIIFYGYYDEETIISPIEQVANKLVWLYARKERLVDRVQWLRTINNNPIELLKVHNPQVVTHALLCILISTVVDDLDTLELIGDIGYWSISKAIEIEPDNRNVYADRLTFMIYAHEGMKWSAMKALNLANSRFMLGNPEFKARDAVYKMTIADMYNHPEVCKSNLILQHRMDMEYKMNSKFFYPQLDVTDIVETGNTFHQRMFDYLTNRIQENDFDV